MALHDDKTVDPNSDVHHLNIYRAPPVECNLQICNAAAYLSAAFLAERPSVRLQAFIDMVTISESIVEKRFIFLIITIGK
jgi:hypothetical protein